MGDGSQHRTDASDEGAVAACSDLVPQQSLEERLFLGLPDVDHAGGVIVEKGLEGLGKDRAAAEPNRVDAELVRYNCVNPTCRSKRAVVEQIHDGSASDGFSPVLRRSFDMTALDTLTAVSFAL